MILMQYNHGLYAKSCSVADVYDEFNLNHILTKLFDYTICHSVWKYWVSNSQSSLATIALKVQWLLASH